MMLCKTLDKGEMPLFISLSKPDKWIAQEKMDGDRIRMRVQAGKISLLNRSGKDVTERYPEFHNFKADKDMFLDGEMCVIDDNGVSQFNEGIAFRTHCKSEQSINEAMNQYPVTFVVFDILEFDNENLRDKPLNVRTEILQDVFNLYLNNKHFYLLETHTDIIQAWEDVTSKGGEGLILKQADSPYRENTRSSYWLKVKDIKEVDLVFTKYTEHNKGIRIETEDEIAITVNGFRSEEVRKEIDDKGKCEVTIRHLGQTKAGRYRQPVFMKVVEAKNE